MVLVLTTAAWNLVRLITSVLWVGVLEYYAPRPGDLYVGATGAAWAAVGSLILWALGRRKTWAPRALLFGAWLYAAWMWLDRILLQAGGSPNWRFAMIGTAVVLGFISAVALDRRTIQYFGNEAHGREHQDQSPA